MNISTILKLFPSAKLEDNAKNGQYFSLYVKDKTWLNIPNKEVSSREKTLLSLLAQQNQPQHLFNSIWSNYLENNGNQPDFKGKVRFLFFNLKSDQDSIPSWKQAIKSMFNSPILDFFSFQINQFCLVEQVNKNSYNLQDFLGVIQTIDSDIGSTTKLFVGHPWSKTNLDNFYQEEKQIFQEEQDKVISSVFSLNTVALPYFTGDKLKHSNLIYYYQKEIKKDRQLENIITALYKNQGNISLTAKDLYLHRNTLLYHLDKVNKNLGLDLKNMDDLVLAYLATLQ